MSVRIAINGFGRIGRASFKIIQETEGVEVVAINDLTDLETLAHLLKYDSIYGRYSKEVKMENGKMLVNGKEIAFFSEKDATKLPWKDLNVDVVLECTGVYVKDSMAKVHLDAGAKKVILSAPAKGDGDIQTFLRGINTDQYLGQNIISNASCTTHSISAPISIIHNNIGIKKASLTTVHAMTASQKLTDSPHKDLREGRAASYNLVPTTTGAAIATTQAIPDLKGKFDGVSVRVPVSVGSLSIITMLVARPTTVEEINQLFVDAKKDPKYSTTLDITFDELVSTDIIGTNYSSIVDLSLTSVVDGDMVRILAWYDNEWGYSHSLVELAKTISA